MEGFPIADQTISVLGAAVPLCFPRSCSSACTLYGHSQTACRKHCHSLWGWAGCVCRRRCSLAEATDAQSTSTAAAKSCPRNQKDKHHIWNVSVLSVSLKRSYSFSLPFWDSVFPEIFLIYARHKPSHHYYWNFSSYQEGTCILIWDYLCDLSGSNFYFNFILDAC